MTKLATISAHIAASRPATRRDLLDTESRLSALIRRTNATFGYSVTVTNKPKNKPMPLQLKITDEQKVNVKLNPVTQRGKPVKIDGKPEWAVVDGDSELQVAEDGLSADLISGDVPGITNFTVSADADLGEGVDTITDTIALTVVDPQASSLGLVADEPADKAPATP